MRDLEKVIGYFTFLILFAVAINGCNNSNKGGSRKPLKIGAILPLTGEMATYGQSAKRGIQVAVEEVNSDSLLDRKGLKLFLEDSQTKKQAAISSLQKMINIEDIKLFIGDISSTITLAMLPIIEQNGAFLFSPGAATPKLSNASKNFARNWPSSNQEASSAASYGYNQMNVKKAAIVYVNNDWGIGLQKKFKEKFETLGGKITNQVVYDLGQTNFRTLIVKLNNTDTPLIYLAGNQKEMGNFIKQLRESGNKTPVIANTSFLEPDCLTLAGKYANGVVVPTPEYDAKDTSSSAKALFYQKFKQSYPNIEPSRVEANGYDAVMLIVKAFNQVGNNPLKISKYIRNLDDYTGAAGNLNFSNGDVRVKTVFKKIIDGKPKSIN